MTRLRPLGFAGAGAPLDDSVRRLVEAIAVQLAREHHDAAIKTAQRTPAQEPTPA